MNGCEDYLKTGDSGPHLRLYRQCTASVVVSAAVIARKWLMTKHYHVTAHPIMEPYDLPERWGWCYADEEMLDFIGNQTIHVQASSVASSIASRNEQSP